MGILTRLRRRRERAGPPDVPGSVLEQAGADPDALRWLQKRGHAAGLETIAARLVPAEREVFAEQALPVLIACRAAMDYAKSGTWDPDAILVFSRLLGRMPGVEQAMLDQEHQLQPEHRPIYREFLARASAMSRFRGSA